MVNKVKLAENPKLKAPINVLVVGTAPAVNVTLPTFDVDVASQRRSQPDAGHGLQRRRRLADPAADHETRRHRTSS